MSCNSIIVENLSKYFEVYKNPQDRLKEIVFPRLQKMIRKPSQEYHQKFWALKDISFEIKKGETVGILGQNGSGKSTLLQIIMGTMSASSGKISTIGKVSGLLELGSGFNPDFTGRENVYLNGSLLGLSKQEINNKFDDIASFADIGEHLDMPVKTYSSGMMLRLAFAVQCYVESDILIIDEALAVGDARFQLKCFRKLQEIKDRGTTILFVSHAVEMVKSFCNRGIVLDYGCVKYIGTVNTAAIRYNDILFPKMHHNKLHNSNLDKAIKSLSLNTTTANKISNKNIHIIDISHENANVFGAGGAKLDSIKITGLDGNLFSGGEQVEIEASFTWDQNFIKQLLGSKLIKPNITLGVALSNKQGLYLFGANGFDKEVPIDVFLFCSGTTCIKFNMPYLMEGDYFLTVAIAVGTQQAHEQLIWYDALIQLKSFPKANKILGLFALDYEYNFEVTNE